MNWKQYQEALRGGRKGRHPKVLHLTVAGGLLLFFLIIFGLFGVSWFEEGPSEREAVRSVEKTRNEDGEKNPKQEIRGWLDASRLSDAVDKIKVEKEGKEWTLQLTIDQGLQKFITQKLNHYKVDWSGVAVLDPRTGEVLALAYHSEVNPGIDHLALRSTFPAASVFKIVTAAAALEEGGLRRDSTVSFSGNMYGIGKRQILKDSGRTGLTLSKAFAKSSNVVFGKIGAHQVGGNLLSDYALKFGFNTPIPFEIPLSESSAKIPQDQENPMKEARTAAGFGDVTLSPLHGAMIAGTILNEGQMMEPYVLRKVVDSSGEVKYIGTPRLWRQAISAVTAREMRKMMATTVVEGTAQRSFRRFASDPILGKLQLGGKTGSLSGKNPPGRNEWFAGYARSLDKQIAVSVVVVNDKVWHVKPTELVKEIFQFYFAPRPILEASNGQPTLHGP